MGCVSRETRRTHSHYSASGLKVLSYRRDTFSLLALCAVLGQRFLDAARKEVPVDTSRYASGRLTVGGMQPKGKPTPLELQLHRVMGGLDAFGVDGAI
jgi:hypothetical protein